jgi:hypothetical protein
MRFFVVSTQGSDALPMASRTYFVVAHNENETLSLIREHIGGDDFKHEFIRTSQNDLKDTVSKPTVIAWSDGPRLLKAA